MQVSVVIPVGEWSDYLCRAVDSALLQGDILGEVILVDNTCTGGREDINLISDPRVRVVKSPKISDAAHARNLGVKSARFQYIAVLDSDDQYLPGHLSRAVDCLESSPRAKIYYCSYINISLDNRESLIRARSVNTKSLIARCIIGHSSVVYRNSDPIIYPEIGRRHDYAAWLKALSKGELFCFIADVGMIRNKREGSLSSQKRVSLFFKQLLVSYEYSGLSFYNNTKCLIKFFIGFFKRSIT